MSAAVITPTSLRTHDTFFAAYLLVRGVTLLDLERDGRRVTFVFGTDAGERLQIDWLGGHVVSARGYADAYQRLLGAIHTETPPEVPILMRRTVR